MWLISCGKWSLESSGISSQRKSKHSAIKQKTPKVFKKFLHSIPHTCTRRPRLSQCSCPSDTCVLWVIREVCTTALERIIPLDFTEVAGSGLSLHRESIHLSSIKQDRGWRAWQFEQGLLDPERLFCFFYLPTSYHHFKGSSHTIKKTKFLLVYNNLLCLALTLLQ